MHSGVTDVAGILPLGSVILFLIITIRQVNRIEMHPLGGNEVIDLNSAAVAGQQALSAVLEISGGPSNQTISLPDQPPFSEQSGCICQVVSGRDGTVYETESKKGTGYIMRNTLASRAA